MKIKVTYKLSEPTFHLIYGGLTPGQELDIEEADFGEELFEKKGTVSSLKTSGSLALKSKEPK